MEAYKAGPRPCATATRMTGRTRMRAMLVWLNSGRSFSSAAMGSHNDSRNQVTDGPAPAPGNHKFIVGHCVKKQFSVVDPRLGFLKRVKPAKIVVWLLW